MNDYEVFKKNINNLVNIDLDYYKEKQMLRRITSLMKRNGFDNFHDYFNKLKNDKFLLDQFVNYITINVSEFYRNMSQWEILERDILPKMIGDKKKPLHIWSSACSTGEEPYSLAVLTKTSGIYESNEVEIVGTDINKKVLNIAQKGAYNKNSLSFRRIPQQWLQTFFHETTTSYEIKDSVKEMVSFRYLNLLDEKEYCEKETYDVIFCRNVLIYFDDETIKKVVTRFYNALKKGGYLFLGHAETISKLNLNFETINEDGTFYYRKG